MLRRVLQLLFLLFATIAVAPLVCITTGSEFAFAESTARARLALGVDRHALTINWLWQSWDRPGGFERLDTPYFIGTGDDARREAAVALPGLRIVSGHSENNFVGSIFEPKVDETSLIIRPWLLGGGCLGALLLLLRFERRRFSAGFDVIAGGESNALISIAA